MLKKDDVKKAIDELDADLLDSVHEIRYQKYLKMNTARVLWIRTAIIAATIVLVIAGAAITAAVIHKAHEPDRTNDKTAFSFTPSNAEEKKYAIKETADGAWYMIIDEGVEAQYGEEAGVRFSSLAEFRTAMKEQTFTEEQIRSIKASIPVSEFGKNQESGIKLYDYKRIYEPRFPSNFTLEEGVIWEGEAYSLTLAGTNEKEFCVFEVTTSKGYAQAFLSFESFLSQPSIVNDRMEEYGEKRVYYYHTKKAELKSVRYTFEKDGYTYTVEERYRLGSTDSSAIVSETVPSRISIYVTNEDVCYIVTIHDPAKAYGYETLSRFAACAYTEI